MKRWIGPLLVLLMCALGVHLLTLHRAPDVIMARAMSQLAERGVALHRFSATPRISPQTQTVVRASPDLYYALCRYDLSEPGRQLRVHMASWPDYQSLSFFDAHTDNFATVRGTSSTASVRLLAPGSAPQADAIISPTAQGVILVRRLAPDAERFRAAAQAGTADLCTLSDR